VARLLGTGMSNREIDQRLGLSPGAARNRVSDVLAKLGARDRTQATVRAAELGLLD
jgi:DNA-binding NarL/FixJ family response regulator